MLSTWCSIIYLLAHFMSGVVVLYLPSEGFMATLCWYVFGVVWGGVGHISWGGAHLMCCRICISVIWHLCLSPFSSIGSCSVQFHICSRGFSPMCSVLSVAEVYCVLSLRSIAYIPQGVLLIFLSEEFCVISVSCVILISHFGDVVAQHSWVLYTNPFCAVARLSIL